MMSTKELIKAEIDKLDEKELAKLYDFVKSLSSPDAPESLERSFMVKA